jgi:CheY-like chemotaxis protein
MINVNPRVPDARQPELHNLLIVDDNLAQSRLFEVLLSSLHGPYKCHHTASGQEALDFLYCRDIHRDTPRPELILLDLNMPGMNGCDVLRRIKRDGDLRRIPVIMFSLGNNDWEIGECYAEQANAYIRKPLGYDATLRVVEHIEQFWFRIATLSR